MRDHRLKNNKRRKQWKIYVPQCNTWGLSRFFQQSHLMPEDDPAVLAAQIVGHRAAVTEIHVFLVE